MPNPILPYAFHPKKKLPPIKAPTSNDDHCELIGHLLDHSRMTSNWCRCKNCSKMKSLKESVCCSDVTEAQNKWSHNWQMFLGDHKGCYALHPLIQQFIQNKIELDIFILLDRERLREKAKIAREAFFDEYLRAEENTMYRFACYRKISLHIHKSIKSGNRVQLPSCIVNAVRKQYPSATGEYKGFEEVYGDDE